MTAKPAALLLALCLWSLPARAQEPPSAPPPATEATDDAPQPAPTCDPKVLGVRDSAIGSLSVMTAFSTAGYLGALADEVDQGGSKADISVRVQAHRAGLEATLASLDRLVEEGELTAGDLEAMAKIRDVLRAQLDQAAALRDYIASGDKAAATRFRELRQSSWSDLAGLIGLEGEVAERTAPGGSGLGLPKGH